MEPGTLAAVLWDMDGTLIDSEPTWIRSQTRLVSEFGGTWSFEDGLALVGTDMVVTAERLQAAESDSPPRRSSCASPRKSRTPSAAA